MKHLISKLMIEMPNLGVNVCKERLLSHCLRHFNIGIGHRLPGAWADFSLGEAGGVNSAVRVIIQATPGSLQRTGVLHRNARNATLDLSIITPSLRQPTGRHSAYVSSQSAGS